MTEHVQIRMISLLEEAAGSIEQIETIANRELRLVPADKVDAVEFRQIERDILEETEEIGTEYDQILLIRYRTELPEDGEA